MANISVIEEKIKKLKKTMAEKSSGSEDQAGAGDIRVFRKNLKRLQRRKRVLLTTHPKDNKGKVKEETIKAKAAPEGEKDAGKASGPKKQKTKSAEEKLEAKGKTEAVGQPEASSPKDSPPEGSLNDKKPEPPAA